MDKKMQAEIQRAKRRAEAVKVRKRMEVRRARRGDEALKTREGAGPLRAIKQQRALRARKRSENIKRERKARLFKAKLNKWQLAIIGCLSFLVLIVMFFVSGVAEQDFSYTYLEVSYDNQVKANKVLGNLIVLGSKKYSQKEFFNLLKKAYPNEIIVEEGNTIIMGNNIFKFTDDRLVSAQ